MRWKTLFASIFVGVLFGGIFTAIALPTLLRYVSFGSLPDWLKLPLTVMMFEVLPISIGVFFYASRIREDDPPDNLTRCGACGYILKGLSEPRCPECGTRL